MKKWPFIVAIGAIGIAGLAFRERQRRTSSGLGQVTPMARVVSHPAAFGLAAGLANGLLATARNKPVSLAATVVTAMVIGISEGMLSKSPDQAFETGFFSLIGSVTGLAPFTRFDPKSRALIERPTVPAPA